MIRIKIVLLLLFYTTISAQNFFPLEDFKKVCARVDWVRPPGTNYYGSYYVNSIISDTIINNQKFYRYNLFLGEQLFMYDELNQKLFIYLPIYDSVFLAADFNLPLNQNAVLYLENEPLEYSIIKIDSVYHFDKLRTRIEFRRDLDGGRIFFMEGLGITYNRKYDYTPHFSLVRYGSLYSAIIDSTYYNPVIVKFDSTNFDTDKRIDQFPFAFQFYGLISNKSFIDSFYIDLNLFRNDTLLSHQVLNFNRANYYCLIPFNANMLEADDIIEYRIVYKDTSIFLNHVFYPDSGYNKIRVLPVITAVEAAAASQDFFVHEPYPNPFNSSSQVKYFLPLTGNVKVLLYDLLGRQVRILLNEEKSAGEHLLKIYPNDLASGIYYLLIESDMNRVYKKIIYLK
jgi:hypothetical protein